MVSSVVAPNVDFEGSIVVNEEPDGLRRSAEGTVDGGEGGKRPNTHPSCSSSNLTMP